MVNNVIRSISARFSIIKKIVFSSLLLTVLSCSSKTNKRIAIQPYDQFEQSIADTVKVSIEKTFGFEVEILKSIPVPETAFINVKSPRYQGDSLIRFLKRDKSKAYDHVIGLINEDISTTKKDAEGKMMEPAYKYEDWGVFGLGYRPGPSCIVSTFRLNTPSKELLIERIKKVCNHELGHNLGLRHCISGDKCVMKDGAESIKTVDHVNLVLCEDCKLKID